MAPGSGAKSTLELVDAALEEADPLLQLGKITLHDLPAAEIVRETGLDAPELLRDHVVLLLEALEPTIDLVEVTQNLAESLVHNGPAFVNLALEVGEPSVDLHEATVDVGELTGEELDELLILRGSHDASVPQAVGGFNPYP
jgi:hypothetical protein